MKTNNPEERTVRVDAATKALIQEALDEVQRGEIFTEKEVEAELDRIEREWEESETADPPA